MSETGHTDESNLGGGDAQILPFRRSKAPESDSEFTDPAVLTPDELTDAFLTGFAHPSMATRPSDVFAERIRRAVDPSLPTVRIQELTDHELAWRQAYLRLAVDGMDLTQEQWDECEQQDPILRLLSDTLHETRSRAAELEEQRRALLGLMDFRLGITTKGIKTDDEEWRGIIEHLLRGAR